MSTPSLETAPLPTGTATPAASAPPAEAPETALIARLANEFFRGVPAVGSAVHEPPAPAPSFPAALAGVPSAVPAQAESQRHGELSGGYPTSASAHPPVHPVLEAGPSGGAPAGSGTPSGGHDPGSTASHPFGEPRFEEHGFAYPARRQEPRPISNSSPQFYFLSGETPSVEIPRGGGTPAALAVFDIEAVRRDFPALHQRVNGHPLIYLDNAATTHKPQSVLDATAQFYGRDNSNIHRAAHVLSERATALFEASREKVRQFLGAGDKKEIVFVRGTTEAVNLVAQSYGRRHIGAGDEIILTELEHHANIVPWQILAEQVGAAIRVIPINDRGELIIEEFVKLLGPRTKIVSVAHVSNALGTVNPVEEIIPLAHARGVPVFVDGAQSTPHLPVNVSALDADFYAFSGHKVFGPTGIGALYGKAHLLEEMPPYQGGGHMIQDVRFERTLYRHAPEKFEAGTPDIAGVVGLGAAIDYLTTLGLPAIAAYEHSLLEYAAEALATVPGLRPIGTAQNKASVLSFIIPGLSNDAIARHLDDRGIAVRAGHHCALPAQRHFGLETTVRPSLALYNTPSEVDALVSVLHGLPR